VEQFFACDAEWTSAYDYVKGQGDTEKQNFESNYGTNYTEYQIKFYGENSILS